MRRVVRFFAFMGFFGFLVIVGAGLVGFRIWRAKNAVPERVVLEINFERAFTEHVPADPVAQVLFGSSPTVKDVVFSLEQAAEDDRVKGLIATFGGDTLGLAKTQEIRDAIAAFRAEGKFAVAFSETFGEVGVGNSSYYLASAFDEIFLQPSGDLGLTGLLRESPFLKRALEKLDVEARGDHRYEYKNAFNMFTETEYTAAHKEAAAAVMNSQFDQMCEGIAVDRKLEVDRVRALFDGGPHLGQEAVDVGLVDGLAYRAEVFDQAKKRAGLDAKLMYLREYSKRVGPRHDSGETIALIYGVGAVQRGASGFDPLFQSVSMGSDSVAAAFREAIEDDDVQAIVFRIDSPGGSYVASDAIWRETIRAKEAGKPVIATMGDVAGSGGYFVAMAADKIVAQPATITGSIGVLNFKMLTSGLWDKIGLDWDEIHTSKASTMYTGTEDFTPEQWDRFQAWLDRVYEDFTGKVAEGRGLTREAVHEVAKGRIWSGRDAQSRGLVDELGGLTKAIELAKEAARIPSHEAIHLKCFPREKSFFETFLTGDVNSEGEPVMAQVRGTLRTLRPITSLVGRMASDGEKLVLRMPAEFLP